MKFPRHDASLHLTHNQHKAFYETLEDYTKGECFDWVNEDQKKKAFENQEIWELQWYPDTPIGSYSLAAYDLDVLLNAAQEIDNQENGDVNEQS